MPREHEKYSDPALRARLKREIQAGDKGGRAGQWSARKSQMLAQAYKRAGGGYRQGKDERARSLERWQDERWQTRDGSTRARGNGETKRYLPLAAWQRLSESQRRSTDRRKREQSRTGKQFVPNTGPARAAGHLVRQALDRRTRQELYEMAKKRHVPGRSHMSKAELVKALQRQGR